MPGRNGPSFTIKNNSAVLTEWNGEKVQSSLAMKNNYAMQKISYVEKRQSLLDDLRTIMPCRRNKMPGRHNLFLTTPNPRRPWSIRND